MSRAFLFTNSVCNKDIKKIIKTDDLVIGVDGGLNTLDQIDLKPDLIIGDFDSVHQKNRFLNSNIEQITHPPEKDFTDTELAIEYAINQNIDQIIIVNNMQERIDHVLGVIASLRYLHRNKIASLILGNNQLFLVLKNNNQFKLPLNTIISLIPLSDLVQGITSSGLYYPLNNEELACDRARGISNVVTNESFEIYIEKGELLLIVNFTDFLDIKQITETIQ